MQFLFLKYQKILLIGLFIQIPLIGRVSAQNNDLKKDTSLIEVYQPDMAWIHSPQKAAMFSAVFPGLGQLYNKSYWKLPLLYGGLGFLGYYLVRYNDQYNSFREAYILRTDNNPLTIDQFDPTLKAGYTTETLIEAREFYRRQRDLTVIGITAVYIANILDAAVDGYLFDYDISEDLSLKLTPSLLKYQGQLQPALSFNFRF